MGFNTGDRWGWWNCGSSSCGVSAAGGWGEQQGPGDAKGQVLRLNGEEQEASLERDPACVGPHSGLQPHMR